MQSIHDNKNQPSCYIKHVIKKSIFRLAGLGFLICATGPVMAGTVQEFDFSYSGTISPGPGSSLSGEVSGSGVLFGTNEGNGTFLLTSGYGTSTEAGNITLEIAGTYINNLSPSVDLIADNLLTPGSNPSLDGDGIVFMGSALPTNSQYFNIWGNSENNYTYFNNYAGPYPAGNGTPINFTVSAFVPEPTSIALLAIGTLGLGFARKKNYSV